MTAPRRRKQRRLNLPNVISGSRIVLTPLVAWAVLEGHGVVALGCLVLVVLSDLLDGIIARHRRDTSAFGTLIDHGADAIFVATLSAVAAHLGLMPFALAPLIVIAFMQYLLDSRAAGDGSVRASRLGRLNGIAYYIVVSAAVIVQVFLPGAVIATLVIRSTGWILVVTTLLSIVGRALYSLQSTRTS